MLKLNPAAHTANVTWIELLRNILDHGHECRPRGLLINELLCHTTAVDMRRPIVSIVPRKLGYKFLAAEAWWILSGRNDVESIKKYSSHIASFSNDGYRFDGAYGPKIVDQLRYVVDTLVKDPDSRQAVIDIWRPNPRDSKDVPCTLTLQWLVRNNGLYCVDTMRSSDAWLGWPYDVFNFSMLSAYVLLMLRTRDKSFSRVNLETLYLTAGSSHLYLRPSSDGATNIPYSLPDVQRVLTMSEIRSPNDETWRVSYKPLDVGEFDDPQQFLHHLSLCKDRLGVANFMMEFQK